jgi:hypothetical protein
MNRVRCVWTGIPSGAGVSTFYFGSGTTNMAALLAYFNSATAACPNGVKVTVPIVGDQVDETTGKITGSWTGSGGGQVTGIGGAGSYAAQSGVVVDWLTSLVLDGRRRQGRTFIVPVIPSQFDTDGTISTGVLTQQLGYATTLIAAYAGEMKIFVRPLASQTAKPDNIPPIKARIGHVGAAAQVIAARVPDFVATLRSRRM